MAFQDIGLRIVLQGVGQFNRDVASAESALNRMGNSITGASGKAFSMTDALGNLASGLTRLGTRMTMFVSIPLAGMIAGLVKAGISFEDAFAGITKTVDGVSDSFGNLTPVGEELREGLRKLALQIPISANELARIGQLAGQLGIPLGEGGKDLLGFIEIIAKVGVSTDLSTEQAATSFARLANIVGVEATDMVKWTQRTADSIVELGNNYATTEPEIIAMALRFAGVASNAGLTTDQILGLAAAVSSLGVQSELGGTTISRILLNMKDASSAAGGATEQLASKQQLLNTRLKEFEQAVRGGMGLEELKFQFDDLDLDNLRYDMDALADGTKSLDSVISDIRFRTLAGFNKDLADGATKLESYARVTGLTTNAFAALVKNSPNEAFKLVVSSLAELDKQGRLTQDVMTELGFGNIRANEVIAKLGPNIDLLTEAQASSTRAMAENIALQEEAQKRFATTASKIQLMKNAVFDLGITLFDRLKPSIDATLKSLTALITGFSNALKTDNAFFKSIQQIVVALIAVGPVLLGVGTAMKIMLAAFSLVKLPLTVIGALLGSLTLPVALLIAGVAALAAIFITDFGGIRTAVTNALGPVAETLGDIVYWLGEAFKWGQAGGAGEGGFLGGVIAAFNALFYVFKDGETTFFSKFFESIGIAEEKAKAWGLAIVDLKYRFVIAFNQMRDAIQPFIDRFIGFARLIAEAIAEGDFSRAKFWFNEALKSLGQAAIDFIENEAPKIAEKLLLWGQKFVEWAWPLAKDLLGSLGALALDIISWIGEQALPFANKLGEWIVEFTEWVLPATDDVLVKLGEYALDITDWIIEQAPILADNIATEWGPAFSDWAKDLWKGKGSNKGLEYHLTQWVAEIEHWIINREPLLLTLLRDHWGPAMTDWAIDLWFWTQGRMDTWRGNIEMWLRETAYALLTDTAHALGIDIAQGMINGMADMAQQVIDSADEYIVTGVLETLHLGFLSRSPSKVTYNIGADIGQGLINGISSKQMSIISLVSGIATTVSSIISGIISSVQSAINAITAAQSTANSYAGASNLSSALASGSKSITPSGTVYSATNNYVRNYSATVNNPVGTTSASSIKSSFRVASTAYG